MDLKNNDFKLNNINKDTNNNFIKGKNKENNTEEDVYFYIMTLQADGQRHQIKIFENSNPSELAFNFCKTYNLDFPTMKYLKKCIKQIILHFNNARKNEMIYLLKDNSSIQEVAEEEIITDNSLKKSGTYKKTNSNNINTEENSKLKKNLSKQNILQEKPTNKSNISNKKKTDKKMIFQSEERNQEKRMDKNNKKDLLKTKATIEDDGKIELKDYSIDYCLENDSVEVFPPTEHTTKIEQKSSIKNSYSLNQKKNSKNKKLQLNNNTINYNRINKKQNCLFNLNKKKKEKNKANTLNNNNDLNNILIQYKDINLKEKSRSKSKTKSKSKEKRFDIEKYFIKKNNYFFKKPKSLEKIKKKGNNITTYIDIRKQELSKNIKNNYKINRYEKVLTNLNDKKNKYFSNYYDYFIKTKNINSYCGKNGIRNKFQMSMSINQESNRSRSISQHKINKNLTQKISIRNKSKKEKSMIHLNTINHQKINNTSKLNLNTILKKDNNSKDKHITVYKNKIKAKYSVICNKNNNNIFNKTINGQCLTSRGKLKNVNGRELFIESKKVNANGIRKMVTESLLNIHRFKETQKDKKKKSYNNGKIIKHINCKRRNSKSKEIFFKNELNVEKSINLNDKFCFEYGNTIINNSINNNLIMKTKRNITDENYIHKKGNIRSEFKKNS